MIGLRHKKVYCIGMEAIKEYGVERWQKEFFMPFSIEDYNIVYEKVYETYKRILSLDISRPTKDVIRIMHKTFFIRYIHFLYKCTLIDYLSKYNYDILDYEENHSIMFCEDGMTKLCNSKYIDLRNKLLTLANVSRVIFSYNKALNIGGRHPYGLKDAYAKKYKIYCEYKSIGELLKIADFIPADLHKECKYIIEILYETGIDILEYFSFSRDQYKVLDRIIDKIRDSLTLCMRFYLGTRLNINLLKYNCILANSLGNIYNRIVMKVFQADNREVVGFSHGIPIGVFYDRLFLWLDFNVLDKYVVQSKGIRDFFIKLLQIYSDFPLAKKPTIEFIKSDYFYKIYLYERKKPLIRKTEKVMFIEPPLNTPFPLHHSALYYPLQLDLTLRIIKILRKQGCYIIMKLRRTKLKDSGYGKIYEGLVDECISRPAFEKVYHMADTFVFPFLFSTTFGFSLFTNKKIIYFLYEKEKYIKENLDLLNKRCLPINCWFDERNRIIFDERELIDAIRCEHINVNTEFLEKQFF